MPIGKAPGRRIASRSAEGAASPETVGVQDPWCPDCRTADHLVFEAAVPLIDAAGVQDSAWDVEYWCGGCEGYFGHETARLPEACAALAADAVYVHCGHAMDTARHPLPAAALEAQLWRCRCGFELSVPEDHRTS